MPVVHVVDQRKGQRRLLSLVFPVRTSVHAEEIDRWQWKEVRAGISPIVPSHPMFGLFTQSGGDIDWADLKRPVALPYLGRETEVESSVQARVLRSVLCGAFDVVLRKDLPAQKVTNGVRTASRYTNGRQGAQEGRQAAAPP